MRKGSIKIELDSFYLALWVSCSGVEIEYFNMLQVSPTKGLKIPASVLETLPITLVCDD